MADLDLKLRFTQWAESYGGEQYRRMGYASLDRIGEPPANDDVPEGAHALERIVQAMEQSGRWKEARVLRAEYFMATLPETVRLAKLRRLGVPVSRTSYYVYLDAARAFVSGALSRRDHATL
jgi:hypothetical protein